MLTNLMSTCSSLEHLLRFVLNKEHNIVTYVCLSLEVVAPEAPPEGSAPLGQGQGSLVGEVRPRTAPVLHGEVTQVLGPQDLATLKHEH